MTTPEENEVLERSVPQAVVLDFDRTLGSVEASMARLYSAADAVGLTTADIAEAQKRIEDISGSFEPLSTVREALDDEAYAAFKEHFLTAEGPAIMYDDAVRLLERFDEAEMPYAVMTYGVNAEWQALKVAASGYKGRVIIMDHTDKGTDMSAMRNEDGVYELSVGEDESVRVRADSLCLVDDKAQSFRSLSEDNTGFMVVRGELKPSQQGALPENVQTITSLDALEIVNGQLKAA